MLCGFRCQRQPPPISSESAGGGDSSADGRCYTSEGGPVAPGGVGQWLPEDLMNEESSDGSTTYQVMGGKVNRCSDTGATSGHRRCCCTSVTQSDGTESEEVECTEDSSGADTCTDDLGESVRSLCREPGCYGTWRQDRIYERVPGSASVTYTTLENGTWALCDGADDTTAPNGHRRCRCTTVDPTQQSINGPSTSGAWAPFAVRLSRERAGGSDYFCNGTLVSPRVVVTASHCPLTAPGLRVYSPYATRGGDPELGAQLGIPHGVIALAESVEVHPNDAAPELGGFDENDRDFALVYLAAEHAIEFDLYPSLADSAPSTSFRAYAMSARDRGTTTPADIRVSEPSAIEPHGSSGLYWARRPPSGEVTLSEPGDSGGGVFREGTIRLIGVHAAGQGVDTVNGRSPFYRVDLDACWIAHKVAAHGGGGLGGYDHSHYCD